MKKKVVVISLVVFSLVVIGYVLVVNTVFNENIEIVNEYVPEMEISDVELRRTIVTLYFIDGENGKISSEARLIDSKELLREPYKVLINMLIEGPKDSNLKSILPSDVKVLNANLNGNCVVINFSEEFVNNAPENDIPKINMIYTIVNTLTELKEVDSVKILVNGKDIEAFNDEINLKEEFVRKD